MSTILKSDMKIEAIDSAAATTKCIYTSPDGGRPYAELSIDWGTGNEAMTAMQIGGQMEPGLSDAYEGLGDRAYAVGPVVMIQLGNDVISIQVWSRGDVEAQIRQVYELVAADLKRSAG